MLVIDVSTVLYRVVAKRRVTVSWSEMVNMIYLPDIGSRFLYYSRLHAPREGEKNDVISV